MAQAEQQDHRLRVGSLVLDSGTRQLTRDGKKIALPRLSYRLFEALALAAPNVISLDQLAELVWPKRVVSPETITQRVKLLRQAIGDDAREPKYIGLVRGQGYRMLAPVERVGPGEPSLSRILVAELGRRRVVQVALLYAAIAWSITEIMSFLLDALPVFPAWSKSLIAIMFVVGFPVAMFLAWRFDIGPAGIERTRASIVRGRMTIVAALGLMIGATAGLFYLIYPSVRDQDSRAAAERRFTQTEFRPDAIAVLPFRLVSDSPGDLYMSEGLGDELRDQLGRIAGLQIAARTSSVSFRQQEVMAQDIAERLGVGVLIEGSLRREHDLLRISVQIIDGQSGLQRWTQSYDRHAEHLLTIQQEIATDVVQQLVAAANVLDIVANTITDNASAYDLMLQARFLEQQVRDEQIVDAGKQQRVIELYRRATRADPESAIAFSRLASASLYGGDVKSAEAPIFRALTLNPSLSDVQYTLGQYYWLTGHELAGKAYQEAIRLNPENANALGAYAQWLWHQGDANLPGEYFRRALVVDPESLARYRDLGAFYGTTGRRDQALALAQDIQLRFDDARACQVLSRIYEQTGDLDVAIAWVRKARQLEPGTEEFRWNIAELYARIGATDVANSFQPEPALGKFYWQRRYDELIDLAEELMIEYPSELQIRYMLAFAYNATGRFEQSIRVLESAGLPQRALTSSRFAAGIEAMVTLADAYAAVGRTADAEKAATFLTAYFQSPIDTGAGGSWWPNLYQACTLSILGQDGQAMQRISMIDKSPELVWEPVLRDAPCFHKFVGQPDYIGVLDHLDERRRTLRERLPATLDRFAESS